jgi:hypothetical protein
MREWSDQDIATVMKLAGSGMSYALIGERFGVTRNAISGVVKRHAPGHQFPRNDKARSNARIASLTRLGKTA